MKSSSFRATQAHVSTLAYRKPQNVHLNPYAVTQQSRGHAFCPFYGDKEKGCRCHEPLNPLARDIIKGYIMAQVAQYRKCSILLSFRNYYKANRRNIKLSSYGVDWQNAKEYVQRHDMQRLSTGASQYAQIIETLATPTGLLN